MGENIASDVTDKALISKIYEQLNNNNNKSPKLNEKRRAEDLGRSLSKEDIQMANKHMHLWSPNL